eukprot:352753-Chlamydomonas_euryale.AAC.7
MHCTPCRGGKPPAAPSTFAGTTPLAPTPAPPRPPAAPPTFCWHDASHVCALPCPQARAERPA